MRRKQKKDVPHGAKRIKVEGPPRIKLGHIMMGIYALGIGFGLGMLSFMVELIVAKILTLN